MSLRLLRPNGGESSSFLEWNLADNFLGKRTHGSILQYRLERRGNPGRRDHTRYLENELGLVLEDTADSSSLSRADSGTYGLVPPGEPSVVIYAWSREEGL